MLYVENIILPKGTREHWYQESCSSDSRNFNGQTITPITYLLEENNILVSWLPLNTTDRLQLMDISVNKPAKEHLKKQFEE